MPVSEDEAANVVAGLPPDSWIARYVVHGFQQTTAPLVYHLGVGITILAPTLPIQYGMRYAGDLRGNNFCLLVGRSGEDRKSSALNVGKEILDAAAPKLIGDYPGSQEGLIDSLAKVPSQVIPISEMGKLLSSAQRGYFEPIKTMLADAWDNLPIQRAKANNKTVRVPTPRLSIAAACSIPYLEKHTLSEDWTGGFMGRWMVLYGRRERVDPNPTGNKQHFKWLTDELKKRALQGQAGWCMGLDSGARVLWNEWYQDVMARQLPHNIIGIRARAPTLARKTALIFGWDFGPARAGKPWRMDANLLGSAIDFTELHIQSLTDLSQVIADHPDARLRRAVLMAIESKGGVATLGEILGVMKMRKRPVVEMLESLEEEGRIKKLKTTLEGSVCVYESRGHVQLI